MSHDDQGLKLGLCTHTACSHSAFHGTDQHTSATLSHRLSTQEAASSLQQSDLHIGLTHLKQGPSALRLQQRFWCPSSKQIAAFCIVCIVWLVQHPVIAAPDMCLCCQNAPGAREVSLRLNTQSFQIASWKLESSVWLTLLCLSKSTFH